MCEIPKNIYTRENVVKTVHVEENSEVSEHKILFNVNTILFHGRMFNKIKILN